ncbi:26S proteasome non-ATPase regulatory subunit 9 [Colias croceus]|uniref:26S proteasome non-ATPase regulatory subunit 9 n=1 Tax=Colias crocea TaxID=72248 RepID=UPI001E27B2F8|nr:26S proteasome non-ATPase regulatory subunit 9 [Colias croceus]
MVGYNMDGPARDRVMKLMQEKDRIESEIRDQTAILETNNVGMQDALVDCDGFPRNDIDVYKVRHARHRIICLQNDHKEIMKQIERGLTEVHSSFVGSSGQGTSRRIVPVQNYTNGHASMNGHSAMNGNDDVGQCFAIVGPVQEGSPAELAGLCENDEILQFGSINHNNFTEITQVHQIVSHSVGQRIQVRVKRNDLVQSITVVPRPWEQPGLLGCQIRRL